MYVLQVPSLSRCCLRQTRAKRVEDRTLRFVITLDLFLGMCNAVACLPPLSAIIT